MERRKFILSVAGVATASGSMIRSSDKTVGLDFKISGSEDIDPSKVDQVVLNFDKLEVKTQYVDSSENPAEIKVNLSIEDGKDKTKKENIELVNGKIQDLSKSSNLDRIKTDINTNKKRIDGYVDVQINIGNISDSYSQSFSIKSPGLPDSEGAEVSELSLSDGKYQLYAYKSDGKFITDKETDVDVLVVGGGGGGGGRHGSGGGAGGLVFVPNYTVSKGEFNVTVGDGGVGGAGTESEGGKGGNSSFDSITAVGGGGGHSRNNLAEDAGEGGSGCGGVEKNVPVQGANGVQPNQTGVSGDYGFGNDGGDGATDGSPYAHGGGGGAGEEGGNGELNGDQSPGEGGDGLSGVTSTIGPYSQNYDFANMFGTQYGEESSGEVYFAGGGGGGSHDPRPSAFKNFGGLGGGGAGGQEPYSDQTDSGSYGDDGENGKPNTGGGGGGGSTDSGSGGGGGNGGSGIVLIRVAL